MADSSARTSDIDICFEKEVVDRLAAVKYREKADHLCKSSHERKNKLYCKDALANLRQAAQINPEYKCQVEECRRCYSERFALDFVQQHLIEAGVPP